MVTELVSKPELMIIKYLIRDLACGKMDRYNFEIEYNISSEFQLPLVEREMRYRRSQSLEMVV